MMALVAAAFLLLSMPACSGGEKQEAPTGAAVAGVPDWVPIYPGARLSATDTRNAGVETYTTFHLDSPHDCQRIFAWYDEKLKVAGFNVSKSTSSSDACSGIMRAEGPGRTRALNLSGGSATAGGSRLAVQAVVRRLPGAGTGGQEARIAAWVPQYPGSKPANVVARQMGPERGTDFSFTTGDDAQTVIGWYERRLKDARFTIVTSTVFDGSTARMTAQDATGRSILKIRIEPAGAQRVVAVEARDGVR